MSRMGDFHKNLLVYSSGVGIAVAWFLSGAFMPFGGLLGFAALFGWAGMRAYRDRHAGLTVFFCIFAVAFAISAVGMLVQR